jgi:hypothetical protein
MRSLFATVRISSKSSIKAQSSIIPPPLTRHDEAPTRITLIETLLKRKAEGLSKEERGEVSKGMGWPMNLRVEKPVTKRMMKKVDEKARMHLKDIIRET